MPRVDERSNAEPCFGRRFDSIPSQVDFDSSVSAEAHVRETSKHISRLRLRRLEEIRAQREQAWLAQHRKDYKGKWVALDGEELLAASEDPDEVFVKARQSPSPLILWIETGEELPFGGW